MRISYWGSDVCSSDLKQRMKILVHDLGVEEFTRQVEEEFAHIATLGNDPPRAEFDRIAAYFTPPPFETGLSDEVDRSDPDFALWVDRQTAAHKAPGYAIANISLKPIDGSGGDITADQLDGEIGRASCRDRVCQYG